ncbi:MAG: leucyl aminopeptidase family protein [bacterium]|nr:leucyl aminopeptidase family protein [bacterium]
MKFSFKFSFTDKPKKGTVPVAFDDKKTVRFDGAVLTLGTGEAKNKDRRDTARLLRKVVRTAQQHQISAVSLSWKDIRSLPGMKRATDAELGEFVAVNMATANYNFNDYKTKPKEGWPELREAVFTGHAPSLECTRAVRRGTIIAEEMNAARALSNIPGGDMTPKKLAESARKAVRDLKNMKVRVLGRRDMQKHKMGAILGVAQGSAHEPQMIIVEYAGGKKGEKPIVLVGKGITYDTGGLGIKPWESMIEMFMDMSGGAVVLHALVAAARLGIKKNVVAVIAAAENSISDKSYRPGDVLKSMSGKTIEVRHTDAEGRLVLADALTYVQKYYKPAIIIDVATLTGAALVALGQVASAILAIDEKLLPPLQNMGEDTGDLVWPLPLWKEYRGELDSKRADIANIAKSRWGGTIEGGMFLAEFVDEKQPWVHIDMAPRMEAIEGDNLANGSTGEPLRLLVRYIEKSLRS